MARKNSTARLASDTPQFGVIGMKMKPSIIRLIAMKGASTKVNLSAKGGSQSSLKKIFSMSAMTCPRPKGPTRLGP